MKYLGIALDGRLNFHIHFSRLSSRIEEVAILLGRLFPNIGDPDEKARRLYMVSVDQWLYIPIWGPDLGISLAQEDTNQAENRRNTFRIYVIRLYYGSKQLTETLLIG